MIRGATLFSGYWPDGGGGPGADGWFVTGDLGYVTGWAASTSSTSRG